MRTSRATIIATGVALILACAAHAERAVAISYGTHPRSEFALFLDLLEAKGFAVDFRTEAEASFCPLLPEDAAAAHLVVLIAGRAPAYGTPMRLGEISTAADVVRNGGTLVLLTLNAHPEDGDNDSYALSRVLRDLDAPIGFAHGFHRDPEHFVRRDYWALVRPTECGDLASGAETILAQQAPIVSAGPEASVLLTAYDAPQTVLGAYASVGDGHVFVLPQNPLRNTYLTGNTNPRREANLRFTENLAGLLAKAVAGGAVEPRVPPLRPAASLPEPEPPAEPVPDTPLVRPEPPATPALTLAMRGGVTLRATNAMEKVRRNAHFVETPDAAGFGGRVVIDAAGGEAESFQLVLTAGEAPASVAIAGVGAAPAEVELRRVGFVNGLFPDVLMPPEPFTVPAGESRAVWVTLKVPRGAVPGMHAGSVALRVNGEDTVAAFDLLVRSFDLPRETHTRTALFNIRSSQVWRAAGGTELDFWSPEWDAFVREQFFEPMAARRISADPVMPHSSRDFMVRGGETDSAAKLDGLIEPEFMAQFAADAQWWIDRGLAVNYVGTHVYEVRASDLDPAAIEPLQRFWSAWGPFLAERDWTGLAYTRPRDETRSADAIQAAANAIHEVAPGVPLLVTTIAPEREFLDAIAESAAYVAFSPRYYFAEPVREFFEDNRATGPRSWWYIHAHIGTLYDSGTVPRLFFWAMTKYGIDGCALFAVNMWQDVEAADDGVTSESGSGGGVLFWPGTGLVLPSERLDLVRDGLEDREYHWLLQRALGEGRCTPEQRVRALGFLQPPEEIVHEQDVLTADSSRVLALRREMAELLEEIGAR